MVDGSNFYGHMSVISFFDRSVFHAYGHNRIIIRQDGLERILFLDFDCIGGHFLYGLNCIFAHLDCIFSEITSYGRTPESGHEKV